MGFDHIVRRARLADGRVLDVGIAGDRIAALATGLPAGPPETDAAGRLVLPGLVESHIHLDKACILDRVPAGAGDVQAAIRAVGAAKRDFTVEDIVRRGGEVLRRVVGHGTMRVRAQTEVDPRIGLRGFDSVRALREAWRWALDLEVCVFAQEGLTDSPETEALLRAALRCGATVIGGAPYADRDPIGQLERVFALADEFDVDIDLHLDMGEDASGMLAETVCRLTGERRRGGRVAIGHVTQMAFLPAAEALRLARRLADAGVALIALPATDLYLTGRSHGHAIPRGVAPARPLLDAGVTLAVATNNVLNPFTPYGDGSLIRMANLYANVSHLGAESDLLACLSAITDTAARLLRLPEYGIAVGHRADLVCLDAVAPAEVVAALAQPLWGIKGGRRTFTWDRPRLHPPA